MKLGTVIKLETIMQEIRRVKKMNAPHMRERERRRKENLRRMKHAPHLEPLVLTPLPYRISRASMAVLAAEKANNDHLKKRTPEEWAKRIARLVVKDSTRKVVAILCWWDYFGNRPVTERWPHLDEYLGGELPYCDSSTVAKCLEILGYSPWSAKQRSEGGSEIEPEPESDVDSDDEDDVSGDDASRCEQAGIPDRSPRRTSVA